MSSISETASRARAQVVAGDRVAALGRQRLGLDRARVALVVELDPEGQLVGQAAVEGDAAAVVGAEEPDLAVAVPGAEGERREHDERRRAPSRPCAGGAGGGFAGELLAALAGGLGGGAAADLGRGQPGLLGAGADQRRALGGSRCGRGRRPRAGRRATVMLSRPPARLASSTSARTAASIEVGAGEQLRDLLLAEHRRQPVGADQEDVAGPGGDGLHVDLDLRLGAERAGDDRALRVVLGLGVGELALAPHLLDQRVVAGEPLELAAAQAVGAAVADVADRHLLGLGVDDRGGDRRPHPGQRGVVAGELVDRRGSPPRSSPAGPARAAPSGSSRSKASAAAFEATSPAWAPPIPSATTKIGARTK